MDKTIFVNMGRSDIKPNAVVVHALENGSKVPRGIFFGYIRGNRVALYPADAVTFMNYRNTKNISVYDLKARSYVGV